jgi:pyrroloquinoline quinone biosynthesis protein D
MRAKIDIPGEAAPALLRHVRIQRDRVTDSTLLLYPEGALELDETGVAILKLCDGTCSLDAIFVRLVERFDAAKQVVEADVKIFLSELISRGLLELRS